MNKNIEFYINLLQIKKIYNIFKINLNILIKKNTDLFFYTKNLSKILKIFKKHSTFYKSSPIDYIIEDGTRSMYALCVISLKFSKNLILLVKLNKNKILTSITSIYQGLNWSEREAFDMFGVIFTKHPNLTRLLTDYNYTKNPQLKKNAVYGLIEIYAKKANILKKPVNTKILKKLSERKYLL